MKRNETVESIEEFKARRKALIESQNYLAPKILEKLKMHSWTELNDGIRELTSKITLDDILNAYRKQDAENGICDYCI